MHIVNLDPAAEVFNYPVAMGENLYFFNVPVFRFFFFNLVTQWSSCLDADIRELVSVDVVMEELKCGPNAALIRCMEYPFRHLAVYVILFFVKKP